MFSLRTGEKSMKLYCVGVNGQNVGTGGNGQKSSGSGSPTQGFRLNYLTVNEEKVEISSIWKSYNIKILFVRVKLLGNRALIAILHSDLLSYMLSTNW